MQCAQCLRIVEERSVSCPGCGSTLSLDVEKERSRISPERISDGLDFKPGYLFAGRYTIIEKAGQGGMGVVYKAIDTALDEEVALKLIRRDLAHIPAVNQRFKKEVRLTHQITHRNVCRVHDLGESQGILYISMEWIDGETLRQLLNKTGTLKQITALTITEKISQALRVAHGHEIIHRDLKPENIMIDGRGEVFVMDFGLAAMRGAEPGAPGGRGGGTPAYMSPEQWRGEGADPRTDLYALGLILHEMLTGTRPNPPPPHRLTWKDDIDPGLRRVVGKLVAERKEERYPSAREAGHALHRAAQTISDSSAGRHHQGDRRFRYRLAWGLVGAAALLSAGALYYYGSFIERPSAFDGAGRPQPVQVYYERGLHYLRHEAETKRGLDDAIQMCHRALAEDESFAPAWACLGEAYGIRFQRTQQDSSREEAQKAIDAALRLDPALPEALNAGGRLLLIEGNFQQARDMLAKVVGSKPDFDLAWANLGEAHQQLGDYGAGFQAFQKAITLEPGRSSHYLLLGLFHDHFAEYDKAISAYEKAVELSPDSTMGWNNLGTGLLVTERYEAAANAFLRSLEIEERASARSNLGTTYFFQGEYEKAVENYRKAADLDPHKAENWGNLGDGLQMIGSAREAREAYSRAADLARERVAASPLVPELRMDLGYYCAKARQGACALSEGVRADELQPGNVNILFRNAVIRNILGQSDDALDWLERAINLGLSRVEIENEPDFSALREHPRYGKLLELAG